MLATYFCIFSCFCIPTFTWRRCVHPDWRERWQVLMKLPALARKDQLNTVDTGRIWMVPEHLGCSLPCWCCLIWKSTNFFGIIRNGKCHVQWQSIIIPVWICLALGPPRQAGVPAQPCQIPVPMALDIPQPWDVHGCSHQAWSWLLATDWHHGLSHQELLWWASDAVLWSLPWTSVNCSLFCCQYFLGLPSF